MLTPAVPDAVDFLYSKHKRARRVIGIEPMTLLEWAEDRRTTRGYEVVDAWLRSVSQAD